MKALLALLLLLFCCALTQARDSRPNLIFLLTDDQRADDLGCYGNTIIQTPHIDSLAQRGVRFTRFFVTSSICMASRASYFTGRVERSHACNFYYRSLAAKDWAQSYPVLLKQAGYHTGFIGKFGVLVEGAAQGLPRTDFDVFEGFPGQGEYFPQGNGGPHLERVMGDQAVRFLRGATKEEKPFCLSVSFKAPHDPLTPDPAFAKRYENEPPYLPAPLSFREIAGLPPAFGDSAWYARLSWQLHCATDEKLQLFIQQRYRLIAGMDAAVGRIMGALGELGLADNTVVLFASDNGYYYGEHGLNTKFYLHEESIRVPFIVMDPRAPQRAGQCVDALTANIDVAPTLLDLAGVKAPAAMQGGSLLPWLRGEKPADWRETIFCENLAKERRPMCDAIRTRDWKYIAYFETEPLQEELYHLANDPREQRNLAADPVHLKTKADLRTRLQAMREKYSGAPTGFPEWIQTQKEDTANWQGYRAQYLKHSGQARTSAKAFAGHWPLESAADESFKLRGKAGTAAGVQGRAVSLDGSSLIEMKTSSGFGHGAEGFAFSIWMNAFAPGEDQQIIAAKSVYSLGEREWSVMVDKDGKIRLFVWQGGWKTVEHKTPPKAGDWHQVGVVMRPREAELWVDGALSGRLPLKSAVPQTAAPLTLGGIHDGGNLRQTFFGALDEARAFDKALSSAEMTALYRPVTATLPIPARPPGVAPVPADPHWAERGKLHASEDRASLVFDGKSPDKLACDTTLRLMPDGSWVMVMLGGGDSEPRPENQVFITRSHDEGKTWSRMQPLDFGFPREGNTIAMVPSELMVHEGRCTLFFATHDRKFAGWKEWMSTSGDSCKTWSTPAPAPGRLHDRTFIRNHIVTRDGRILLPFQHYLQGPGPFDPRNGVLISSDGGKTWSEHGNIRLTEDDSYHGWAENNIVELGDGRIAMIIRADKLGGVLYYAESIDGGRTWPEFAVKTAVPNPGSKATLYGLGGDRVALLHNPNPKVRSPLALWVSFDGMKTWPYQRVLRGDLTGRFNYPDGFVSADKKWLHFAFDHNRDKAIHVSARLPEVPVLNPSK